MSAPSLAKQSLMCCCYLQLSTGSDDSATDHLGLIIGLSVGIFVALVFIIGELFLLQSRPPLIQLLCILLIWWQYVQYGEICGWKKMLSFCDE